MFNAAKKGDTILVAMYGMSPSSPESKALEAAAKRGCKVRVVVNDNGTDTAVAFLEKLRKDGHNVEVRIQRAKTMHEKFGVVGDDMFFGSANFSESSSSKHNENRVALKNQPRLARRFTSQFEMLWSKSKVPV
jgi:phosphatidylserine/phosphatidylglycerophosphate/cardiolipin synthase-like enzyme